MRVLQNKEKLANCHHSSILSFIIGFADCIKRVGEGGNNQKPLITKYFSARTPWYNRLFDPNF